MSEGQSPLAGMVKNRLREWAGWVHSPAYSAYPSSGVEYRILKEQENAGRRGDGMKFEIIEVNGESIACRPDGGMSQHAQRAGRQLALDNRCIETHKAIGFLPLALRQVIIRRWIRPDQRDKPLSFRDVGNLLEIPEETARDRHAKALTKLERHIYGPFTLAQEPAAGSVSAAA